MSGLQSLLSHPAVVRFGWALIHFLWQGAAVAVLLTLTLLLLRRATAGARYVAACGALLLMTAAPVLTYWHLAPLPGSPQRALAGLPELPDNAPSGNVAVSAPAADPSAARVSPRPPPLLPPAAPRPWQARAMHWIEANLRWFVGAWFCGVLCLSIRLLFGWSGVRRIRRSGVGASETLQDRLKDLTRKLSVARPVRLLTSAIADAPVVIGWFRPVILFPASVLTQLSPQQLEAILAHELAHVRRHDYLVNLFQTVAETLLFYHPAVHWVSRRVRVEREHCCDDLAVSACGDPALYARALARLAEMSVAAPRLVPAAGGQLLGRIRRLLSADARRDRRASVWVGGTVLIAALLACVVALGASKAGGEQKAEAPAANGSEIVTPLDEYSRLHEVPATDDALRAPTPEEIRKFGALWPDVPAEQNAAYYFAKAAKAVAPFEERPAGSLRGIEPYTGNVAAFEKWVELNQPAFKLMREGLKQKVYRPIFLISKKEGQPVADVEFLAAVRNLARTCADAGFLAELQGRPDDAARTYAECLQLGTALRQHGPLIQELVAMAIMAIGQRNMDALVANGGLDEAALRTVIRQCREAEVRPDEPATCWATEVAYGEVLMSLEKNPAGNAIIYDQWRKQRAALSRIIEKKTLAELLQQNTAKEIVEIGTKEPGAVPDPIFRPIVRAFGELGRLDVRLRATEIRAAIALYQKAHGAPPDSLDLLCPGILPSRRIDPFSGEPMRYARTETGWKVWSVGEDNVDHGGVSDETPEALRRGPYYWKGPDYVFLSDIASNLELRSTMGKPQSASPLPSSSPPASTEKPAEGGSNLTGTKEAKTIGLDAILKQGPGQPASQELISKMLKENSPWLRPPLRSLAYTFSMAHTGKDNTWEAEVAYTAPNDLTIAFPKEKIYSGKADDTYDPRNTPYPIGLRTIVQGVTFVSPLEEFQAAPQRYGVSMIGEEAASGREAFVLHIKPIGRPSEKAIQQWDAGLRAAATGAKYEYEFFPAEQEIGGVKRTVIGLKCLREEGPSWKALLAAQRANPARIEWGEEIISLSMRDLHGETRPVIVREYNLKFTGKSSITVLNYWAGGENGTPDLFLGEGERMMNEAYYRELKARNPGPKLTLPMRVACGIWDRWYGFRDSHADLDQVWIDKETGDVLREEGFLEGRCEFVIEYGDWEALPDGGRAPTHVTVSLPPSYPDTHGVAEFDMRFTTLGGKAWILDHLAESFDAAGVSVTATVSDVNAVPENPMEAPPAEKAKGTPASPQAPHTGDLR